MRDFIRIMLAVALALMSIAGIGSVAVAAPTGSISGCVQTDNGTPIEGAHVVAYSWDTEMFAGEARTIENGTYSIAGLAPARYRVKTDAAGYFAEYYREGGVVPITVFPSCATNNIDFTLTPGSSISGHVYREDGATPIDAAHVVAYRKVGCTWECAADEYSDADGSYSVTTGTDEGTYRLKTEAAGYAAQYYSEGYEPAPVAEIQVSAGERIDGLDFTLRQTGFISGAAYRADGVTPISGVHVIAYDNATEGSVGEGFSGANAGSYYINLIPGTYRLRAEATGYVGEWYADVTSFDAAASVTVVGLDERPDVNFALEKVMGVSTLRAADIAETSVRLNGELTSLGAPSEAFVSFVWGNATGSCTHETPRQVRNSKGYFSSVLTGLCPGSTYYYKAKATGDSSAVYGEERSFTTADDTPPLISQLRCDTTTSVATITWTTSEPAISQIDFGLTADYSNTTGPSAYPVTGHSINLVDLRPDSTYHYRIICWDASSNEVVTRDYTFGTHVYYGGMATQTWKIVGFGVVAVVGALCCLAWVRIR